MVLEYTEVSLIAALTGTFSQGKLCELCQDQGMIHSWSDLSVGSSTAVPDTYPLVYSLLPE